MSAARPHDRPELERSADILEQAEETTTVFTQAAIATARDALEPETHPNFDGSNCVDCEDEIPAARLALRRVRCIRCQETKERVR